MLAEEVGRLLRSKDLTISVAESCTGGKVGDLLTDVSGSSDYFVGGVISYSNRAKSELLGVRENTLAAKGAVSDEVARQMASGVRKSLHANIGVGITGIAGPFGGTPKKPVGLVYIAVDSDKGTISARSMFKGSRTQVKKQSAERALNLVKRFVSKKY
ncbi:MAG TPA: CinA family protein [Thermoplasmata archaeon]|nr:CinA family protein [Thermoplasmata archaeon]